MSNAVNLTGMIGTDKDAVWAVFDLEVTPTPDNPNYSGTLFGRLELTFGNGEPGPIFTIPETSYTVMSNPNTGEKCAYLIAMPLTDEGADMKRVLTSVFRGSEPMNLAGFMAPLDFLSKDMMGVPTGVIAYDGKGGNHLPVTTEVK